MSLQEAHGPYRSPEKHFQPINALVPLAYLYHNVDQERKKTKPPFKELNGPYLFKVDRIPFTLGCFVPSLDKFGPVVLEKNF